MGLSRTSAASGLAFTSLARYCVATVVISRSSHEVSAMAAASRSTFRCNVLRRKSPIPHCRAKGRLRRMIRPLAAKGKQKANGSRRKSTHTWTLLPAALLSISQWRSQTLESLAILSSQIKSLSIPNFHSLTSRAQIGIVLAILWRIILSWRMIRSKMKNSKTLGQMCSWSATVRTITKQWGVC